MFGRVGIVLYLGGWALSSVYQGGYCPVFGIVSIVLCLEV